MDDSLCACMSMIVYVFLPTHPPLIELITGISKNALFIDYFRGDINLSSVRSLSIASGSRCVDCSSGDANSVGGDRR